MKRQRFIKSVFLKSGFTLVELLVAGAIFLILVLLLAAVVNSSTTLSSQATARLEAVRLTREILALFNRDLAEAAMTRPSLGTNVPLQFLVNPDNAFVGPEFKNPSSIFWQSSMARDHVAGNVAVVGYFVQRPSSNQSQLRRVFLQPQDSLYRLYDASNNWISSNVVGAFAAPSGPPSTANSDQGWVADGVLGLWIRCLDANGNVISNDGAGLPKGYSFDSRRGFRSGTGTNQLIYSTFNAYPAFVDVGLVCVSPRDVHRIDSFPAFASTSPTNMESEMAAFLTSFNSANPRVKSGVSILRRFPLNRSH